MSDERDRARRQSREDIEKHELAIEKVIRASGHRADSLSVVDGEYISFKITAESEQGVYGLPNGRLRLTIRRGYRHSPLTFIHTPKKNFDHQAIAKAFIDLAAAGHAASLAAVAAEDQYDLTVAVARRLAKEFGLLATDFSLPRPLYVDRGHAGLELKFSNLTEDQARALMGAARGLGLIRNGE